MRLPIKDPLINQSKGELSGGVYGIGSCSLMPHTKNSPSDHPSCGIRSVLMPGDGPALVERSWRDLASPRLDFGMGLPGRGLIDTGARVVTFQRAPWTSITVVSFAKRHPH